MFTLPEINYDIEAFEKLSKKSFEIHYGGHHASYVKNLNTLIEKDSSFSNKTLEEIIRDSYKKRDDDFYKMIFNNAAQHWNHSFFWNSICPEKTMLDGDLKISLEEGFGSIEDFYLLFEHICLSVFGSGWVWIVYNKIIKKIEVKSTSNAENLIQNDNLIPLLCCDIWEHSYYIDFLNSRKDYIKTIFDYFNWDFAQKNYINK